MKKKKNLVVAKHNDLIQSRMPKITLLESRIINMALGYFNPTDPKMGLHFTVKEFAELYGLDEKVAYQQAEKAVNGLFGKGFILRDDEYVRDVVAFVNRNTYFKKEGRFYIEFHEEVRPFIAQLQQIQAGYTKYYLEEIAQLKSQHSVRMYEIATMILKKYQGEHTFPIDDIKFFFNIQNKYKAFYQLRVWVLQPATDEVNDKTDLLVHFEPIRLGRGYSEIRFTVHRKRPAKKLSPKIVDPVFGEIVADSFKLEYWEKSRQAWALICEKYGVDVSYIFDALTKRQEKIPTKGRQHYFSLTDKYLATILAKIADIPQGAKYITEQVNERRF
ncbi:hypothetical protein A6A19_08905 [Actinobacillus delphinicola]|uniref:replication initiation protein n=1 Tax=Actinobacillus delphinicola TaxID=51161 RepID=UPI002441EC1F|nr:replication initiation protein [Actinobacillus delphinicola]MDG6898079.1 hypothetical protein [Actinobacillus delphinicola]MDG6898086.1 hypothetical protein [Actinobacillus delphinicola]MDG6898093.1 hypothetical protein [Actinobacillus delphinicola]